MKLEDFTLEQRAFIGGLCFEATTQEREACAKFVEPSTPRPCDCQRCDCGNADDAQRTAEWDAAKSLAASIRSR